MQKTASSNLSKLRFMQRGEKPRQKTVEVAERLLDDEAAWVIEGFEEVHKAHCAEESQPKKNLNNRYASRKSFNGTNPYIERLMQAMRKRR
ncbi:M-phase phospho 6, putative [Babesia ovata]|uniref:M-phase phospho 6, putative n=1 Tax=Babesia ovata TaxID=189622 RepID=A0A2H6KDQ1_9APIC|nr:M-phase phospho 6, putative [Babesia ovata]GBE61130.1 M-phase phospho 6, putative [Babesia ovata]